MPTTRVRGHLACKSLTPAVLLAVPMCSAQMYGSSYTAACRAALLAVYSAEALLLAFALKLKVSAAIAGKARPALHSARPFRGGGNAAQWDRAAGFLGSCMPQMQPLRGGGKPPQSSGFKVGRANQPAGADSDTACLPGTESCCIWLSPASTGCDLTICRVPLAWPWRTLQVKAWAGYPLPATSSLGPATLAAWR